jgi:nucleoid DNA-binding protein
VTKKDLAKRVAKAFGLTDVQALAIVQRTLDEITEALAREGKLELRDFGVFTVKQRGSRKAHVPSTGARVVVPPRKAVTFKAGRKMEGRVNGPPGGE